MELSIKFLRFLLKGSKVHTFAKCFIFLYGQVEDEKMVRRSYFDQSFHQSFFLLFFHQLFPWVFWALLLR